MTRRIFTSLIAVVVIAGFALIQTGCNTVEGAGKDIEKGGEAVQKAAD